MNIINRQLMSTITASYFPLIKPEYINMTSPSLIKKPLKIYSPFKINNRLFSHIWMCKEWLNCLPYLYKKPIPTINTECSVAIQNCIRNIVVDIIKSVCKIHGSQYFWGGQWGTTSWKNWKESIWWSLHLNENK